MHAVRVAVIDVGSNSVRLLIAAVKSARRVRESHRDRVYLRLGDDAYLLGRIGARKLDELELVSERFAQSARKLGVDRLETIVTAPGRQSSNADELVDVLNDATRAPVRLLSAEDEGRLAWHGAVTSRDDIEGRVAVVDLGGGSCEIAVGTPETGPTWVGSREAGALRITRELLSSSRPGEWELRRARAGVRTLLSELEPPPADATLAVGGTTRAVRKLVGPRLGVGKLDALAERLAREGAEAVCSDADVTPGRMETLLGGALVLAELARRLDTRLEVASGGLREGAALALARVESVAA
jgi:exopolyphosphatase/guanosine-5'-triphosphate,3'-diphosphate pyrophosphatase